MLNDPMLIAEMIAEKRDAEDAKWRAQMEDLKAREAWHDYWHDQWLRDGQRTRGSLHRGDFADCNADSCRGEVPVPR